MVSGAPNGRQHLPVGALADETRGLELLLVLGAIDQYVALAGLLGGWQGLAGDGGYLLAGSAAARTHNAVLAADRGLGARLNRLSLMSSHAFDLRGRLA